MADAAGRDDGAARLSPAARALLAAHARRAAAGSPGVLEAPLSASQLAAWVFAEMHPETDALHRPQRLGLRGSLDAAALGHALADVAERHAILGARLVDRDGVPVQQLQPGLRPPLAELDLRDQPERLAEVLDEDARAPFRLATGPLLRALLVRTGAAEWVLQVTAHHLAFDGWSAGILIEELGRRYAERRRAAPVPPPLPCQFTDLVDRARRRESGEAGRQDVAFWTGYLRDRPATWVAPDLPPADPRRTGIGRRVELAVEGDHAEALRRIARDAGVTLPTLALTAFGLLVARRTGAAQAVIGHALAGRDAPDAMALIGSFSVIAPVRVRAADGATVAELLRVVHRDVTAVMVHGAPVTPLGGTGSRTRVGEGSGVVFNFRGYPMPPPALAGLEVRVLPPPALDAVAPLSLNVVPSGPGLACALEYDTALFTEGTARRWLDGFHELLRAMAALGPAADPSRLPVMAAGERELLLRHWGRGEDLPVSDETVIARFEAQAARTPAQIAVVTDRGTVTYGELDRRATALARALAARGIGRGTLVGLYIERSAALVTAIFGTLKAGAAYLPVDPSYPPDRVAFMLADARVRLLLTAEGRSGPAGAEEVPALAVPEDGSLAPTGGVPVPPAGSDAAYVIYTSGSTGRPKGAVIHHAALANHMAWMQAALPCGPDDLVLQRTPASFDGSVWEFYATLLVGGRLMMAGPDGHRDPGYLADMLEAHPITVLQVGPSLLQVLLDTGRLPRARALRRICCGGEALPGALVARCLAASPAELVNLYGPTEVTINGSFWVAPRDGFDGRVTIGRPIANGRVYVLDERGELLPAGAPGELHLGGPGVGLGYLHRPELTAERFVADPFAAAPGARMYRTGDAARFRADGQIEYLGRLDHQVKLRGFRVELGEIEEALASHPAVAAAVVTFREDLPGGQRLVGYVTWRAGHSPATGADLREHLGRRLPDYMVPAAYVTIERWPLSPSGKVDRAALPAPPAPEAPDAEWEPPRPGLEAQVAGIWAEVLGLPRVGALDDFLELGGHSLDGLRVLARLGAATGLQVPFRTLIEAPTVRAMARAIERLRRESPAGGEAETPG